MNSRGETYTADMSFAAVEQPDVRTKDIVRGSQHSLKEGKSLVVFDCMLSFEIHSKLGNETGSSNTNSVFHYEGKVGKLVDHVEASIARWDSIAPRRKPCLDLQASVVFHIY